MQKLFSRVMNTMANFKSKLPKKPVRSR